MEALAVSHWETHASREGYDFSILSSHCTATGEVGKGKIPHFVTCHPVPSDWPSCGQTLAVTASGRGGLAPCLHPFFRDSETYSLLVVHQLFFRSSICQRHNWTRRSD